MWKLDRRGGRVYVRAGSVGGPLHWLPVRELRQFADALHDLADERDDNQEEAA